MEQRLEQIVAREDYSAVEFVELVKENESILDAMKVYNCRYMSWFTQFMSYPI